MGVFRFMGIVPLGIGVTVLGFLWLTPFNDFHSPPLFFRIFGSFIALSFVMTGIGLLSNPMSGLRSRLDQAMRELERHSPSPPSSSAPPMPPGTAFSCPNCGASLGDEADVSPNGDVKCVHCRRWFNIHRTP